MRQLLLPALLAGLLAVVFLVVPGIGAADPNLGDVAAHRHFLVTGTGESRVYLAEVGPDLCDNPKVQNGFNQYHNNNHRATDPNAIGPVNQGLHNLIGAEIVPMPCSFHLPS